MTIDPILSLAVTIQSNPGAYALLLGSGTSRSAGIPTGWELTLALVRRVAAAAREDTGADPEAWYIARFGRSPRYSEVLTEVTRSRSERQQLLREYFEPTEEERQQDLKVPTRGHRAIARLVASGYVRLIVETNFDHLVEAAIRDAGIEPTILTTPDALKGATPIDRSKCTIAKLHGDYLDTRIRNTEDELATYPPALRRFLDRVLDEFGFVVVGWSGEWDTALRAAFERRRGRRYGIYWAARSDPNELAARLIAQQGADIIRISDADSFLSDLQERVQAVADTQQRAPVAIDAAVASVKRFVIDPAAVIRLNDLVAAETERVHDQVGDNQLALPAGTISVDLVTSRARRAEVATEVLRAIVACGTYWSGAHDLLWVRALQRIANHSKPPTMINEGFDPRFLPALLVYYAAGIGAIAGRKYDTLRAILFDTKIVEYEKETPIVAWLWASRVLDSNLGTMLAGNKKVPTSDYLEMTLRASVKPILITEREYLDAFDRFEYLAALAKVDLELQKGRGGWAPVGQFGWRQSFVERIGREINEEGAKWPAIQLFQGADSLERLNTAREVVAKATRPYVWMT